MTDQPSECSTVFNICAFVYFSATRGPKISSSFQRKVHHSQGKSIIYAPSGERIPSIDYFFIETRNKVFKLSSLNPLHPNIIMHILHTVLYTIAKVLTRRICLTVKILSVISSILVTLMCNVVNASLDLSIGKTQGASETRRKE